MNRLALLVAIVVCSFCVGSCRSVHPVQDIRYSTQPYISRLLLRSGKEVVFDRDLGWYDAEKGIVEGMTPDSQHVSYTLTEINKIETTRDYALIPALFVGVAALGAAVYVVYRLLGLFP